MPDDKPCKEYALYISPHGKRKPGRQRTLFLRYIQHLLGDTDNMIGPGKLSELAQDRCGWRKRVVACSAADRWWWWWWISLFFLPSASFAIQQGVIFCTMQAYKGPIFAPKRAYVMHVKAERESHETLPNTPEFGVCFPSYLLHYF